MRLSVQVPSMIIWLTVLWIALWGSLTWANVLGGLAVAIVVTAIAHTGSDSGLTSYLRPLWAIWYVLVVLGKLIESNLRLAWEIITPGFGTHTAIIAVPMRGGSDAVVNLVANSITLTPGTMTVDVVVHDHEHEHEHDQDHAAADVEGVTPRITLYVHGMYAEDPEAVRHEILELEAIALRAFGSVDDYLRAERDVVEHIPLLEHQVSPRAEQRAERRARRGRQRDALLELDQDARARASTEDGSEDS